MRPTCPMRSMFPTPLMKRRDVPCLLLGLVGALAHHAGAATTTTSSDLVGRLQGGRHVLLVRHAYAPGVGDPPGFVLDRCETQRVLDEEGRRQAARIGQWLRTQGVAQARVYTSPRCRCRETAELMRLGPVSVEASLGSFFSQPQQAQAQNARLQAFIARAMSDRPTQPLVLVTHHVNIREFTGRDIGTGDMVLATVDARGRMVEHRVYPSP